MSALVKCCRGPERRLKKCLLLLTLTLPLLGCHKSGVWKNDPAIWDLVFARKPAKDTHVVNSWYWRSWHPRPNHEYFFELEPDPGFRKQALESGAFLDATPTNDRETAEVLHFINEKPLWFVPRSINNYEVFQGKPPQPHFRLFIDKDSGELFITDFKM